MFFFPDDSLAFNAGSGRHEIEQLAKASLTMTESSLRLDPS